MNINTATGRQVNNIVGQDDAICDDDDQLWCKFLHPRIFIRKVFGLQDKKFMADRAAFYRTGNDFSSAPRSPIWSGIDRCNLIARVQ